MAQSQQKGKVHSELVMKRNETRVINLFKKKSADSTATTANDVQVVSNCVKSPFFVSEDVLDREIIWCLYLVHSHQSNRSSSPFPIVFKRMLKTSLLMQQFHMKKEKARYMIVCGLYPVLKGKQKTRINASPWFSVSLNESFINKNVPMYVNIPFWGMAKKILLSLL